MKKNQPRHLLSSLLAAGGIFLAALSAGAAPVAGERVPLWPSLETIPDFQPHQIGEMTDRVYSKNFVAADHRMPYLEWFAPPARPNGGCMILVSGGSYQCCCDVRLVKNLWRARFTELGFVCVNLVYRTPRATGKPCYWSAWQDGQRAVRLVRAAANARGFDPERIGVIGMSAGGHLATMLATSALSPAYRKVDARDDLPCHVNWAVCCAPAYNTRTSAAGIARPEDGTLLLDSLQVNPCFAFDAKTCPISFHHGGTDIYTPNGSTLCYRELRRRRVPAELHLYADRGHGAHGLERAVEFIRQMNFDGRRPPETERRHVTGAFTARTVETPLWNKVKMPHVFPQHRQKPFLTWYLPKKMTTSAVQIIFPGGAYARCNVSGEGLPAAEYFNSKGMAAVIVTYRTPRPPQGQPKHLVAWADAQRAVRLVRAAAPSYGCDPERLGVMGFSAGGHLTLLTALSSTVAAYAPVDRLDRTVSCRVQWACPIYPAYALTDGADRPNATGGNDASAVPVEEFLFDVQTPPMCFVHGDADGWAAMNSVKIWERLRRMGVQSDLHTLASRGHCFQFKAADGTGSATWLDRVWEFLTSKRFNRPTVHSQSDKERKR
jgi:acetyl esterase/lipase